jgi:hypothetical protein
MLRWLRCFAEIVVGHERDRLLRIWSICLVWGLWYNNRGFCTISRCTTMCIYWCDCYFYM